MTEMSVVHCMCSTLTAPLCSLSEVTPAVDNNLQATSDNLFISASFFSGDTVLTV